LLALRNNGACARFFSLSSAWSMEALMRKLVLSIAAAAALLTAAAAPAMAQFGVYAGPGFAPPLWWGYGYNALGYPNGGGYPGGGGYYNYSGGPYTGAGYQDYYGGPNWGGQYYGNGGAGTAGTEGGGDSGRY
jgi:hypothetical protein